MHITKCELTWEIEADVQDQAGNLLETDTYRYTPSPDTSSALMEYFKQKGCACEREILRVEMGGEG